MRVPRWSGPEEAHPNGWRRRYPMSRAFWRRRQPWGPLRRLRRHLPLKGEDLVLKAVPARVLPLPGPPVNTELNTVPTKSSPSQGEVAAKRSEGAQP